MNLSKTFLIIIFSMTPGQAWSAEPPQSLFLQSVESYRLKDYQRSREILRQLVRIEPSNALYWFNLGNANFMLGKYNYAERSFARVERLRSPLALPARLNRARALRESGDIAQSRSILQALISQGKLPPALRDQASRELLLLQEGQMDAGPGQEALRLYKQGKLRRALRVLKSKRLVDEDSLLLRALILIGLDREDEAHVILKRLESRGKNESFKGLVQSLLAGIRDTYSKPKWVFVEAAFGADSNIRQSSDAEAGALLLTDFGAGGRLWARDLWYLSGGYIGNLHEDFGERDLRVLVHEAQANFGREVGTDLVLLTPYVQHESWADDPSRLNNGLRLRLRKGNENWEFGLDTEWGELHALSDAAEGTSGHFHQARLYAGGIFFPVYGQAFLDVERQLLADPTYSNRSWAPGVHLLWKLRADWAVRLSGSYRTREYEASKGSETDLSARLTYFFSSKFSTYLLVDQLRTDEYKQTQVLAGIVWDMY